MQTILYDVLTSGTFGDFREGPYLFDGRPVVLPENLLELEVVEQRDTLDVNTHYFVRDDYIDLPTKTYNIHYVATEIPAGWNVPHSVSARNIRLALIAAGISMGSIDSMINGITDVNQREIIKIYWEFSTEVQRDHALIIQFSQTLGLSSSQVDELFKQANKII